MSELLKKLNSFDLSASEVIVWAFKTSLAQPGKVPAYTGRWIETTQELDAALKRAIGEARSRVTEIQDYGLLAQVNEGSALTISFEETYAHLIVAQTADPTPAKKVKKLKQINNASFYVVKLVVGESRLYGVRKTDNSWQTKRALEVLSVIYSDNKLGLEHGTHFTISKYFDFFIVENDILITNKPHFESVLSYRQAHITDFIELQKEQLFLAIFSDIQPVLEYVGTNKMQLRRVSAIREKGHYKNSDFMIKLRSEHRALGLTLAFDELGRIIPTQESCRDIFQALLDHRLNSQLSNNLYDVENTSFVGKQS